jgi:hypothetical protein
MHTRTGGTADAALPRLAPVLESELVVKWGEFLFSHVQRRGELPLDWIGSADPANGTTPPAANGAKRSGSTSSLPPQPPVSSPPPPSRQLAVRLSL